MCLPIVCADCSGQYSKFRLLVNREINAVRALLLHGFTNPSNAPPLDAAMQCMMAMLSNSGRMHRMRYMNNYQRMQVSSQLPTATATLITTPPPVSSNTTTTGVVIIPSAPSNTTTGAVITPSAPSNTTSGAVITPSAPSMMSTTSGQPSSNDEANSINPNDGS